jgi:hypothetical protein
MSEKDKSKDESVALQQRWVHSHEEDTQEEMVFRPSSYNFPRSRGRKSFTLNADGSLLEIGIAPTDARQQSTGTWKLDGDELAFYTKSANAPSRVLKIASVDEHRLVVKKQ